MIPPTGLGVLLMHCMRCSESVEADVVRYVDYPPQDQPNSNKRSPQRRQAVGRCPQCGEATYKFVKPLAAPFEMGVGR